MMKRLSFSIFFLMLLLCSAFSLDFSQVLSWQIPQGEVAKVEIDGQMVWPSIPYVTNGLIAYWDGKWNAGLGVHDENATVWKDLVGNRDATLSGDYSWLHNAWSVNSVSNQGLATWNGGDNFPSNQTIQIVIMAKAFNTNGPSRILSSHSAGRLPIFGFYQATKIYFASYNTSSKTFTIDDFSSLQKHQYTITHEANSTNAFIYVDGELKATYENADRNSNENTYGYFANWNSSRFDRGIDAEYFAVRIYDRVLTAEEIAHNAAIDAIRFGIE